MHSIKNIGKERKAYSNKKRNGTLSWIRNPILDAIQYVERILLGYTIQFLTMS